MSAEIDPSVIIGEIPDSRPITSRRFLHKHLSPSKIEVIGQPVLSVVPCQIFVTEEVIDREVFMKLLRMGYEQSGILQLAVRALRGRLNLSDSQAVLSGGFQACSVPPTETIFIQAHQEIQVQDRFTLRETKLIAYKAGICFGEKGKNVGSMYVLKPSVTFFPWGDYFGNGEGVKTPEFDNPAIRELRDDFLIPVLETDAVEENPKAISIGEVDLRRVSLTHGIISVAAGYFR